MNSQLFPFSAAANDDRRWYGHPVIAGALLLLSLMVGMLVWGLYQDHRHTLDSAGERLQTQLSAYGSALDIAFISAGHSLKEVILELESKPEPLEHLSGARPLLLRSMMKSPSLGAFVLYARNGRALASVGEADGLRQRAPHWVSDAMDAGSHLSMGIDSGRLGLVQLLYDAQHKVSGALLVTMESDQIEAELESGEGYGKQHLLLLDNRNRLLQVADNHPRQEADELMLDLQHYLALDEFNAFGTRLIEGDQYLFAIRQLRHQPVRVLAATKRQDVLSGWQLRALVSAISLGTLLLVALFFLNRWRKSLVRERKTANDLAHMYQAVDQMPSSIAITDLSSRIIYVNQAYLTRSGMSPDQVIGQKPSILASGATPETTYQELWAQLHKGEAWEGEFLNRMRDGSQRIENALITPVYDIDGCVASYFAISSDVTEKKENEKRLFRYREIVNSSDELMALLDTDLRHCQVNQQYLNYHQRTRAEVEGESFWELYESEDFHQLLKPSLDDAFSGTPFVEEAWLEFQGRGRRYCRISGSPVAANGKGVEMLVLNLADITQRKQSEEALRASEERFRALSEFSPIGIFETDAAGHTIYANKYFIDILGLSVQQLGEQGWTSILHPDERQSVALSWQNVIVGKHRDWHCEARMLGQEGELYWVRCAARRYEDVHKGEARYIGMVLDISEQVEHREELERKNDELKRLSTTDALTGLANRGRMEALLSHEVDRYERYGVECAVIMLDVDHFKQVNDTCGHAVGDQVLRQLAGLMCENTRQTDHAGRWGGEEFLILCPHTDLAGAHRLAENLRHRIEQVIFPVIGHRTCSFGVAEIHPGDQGRELLKRVDDALYRAKNNGRNQVIVAEVE